MNRYIVTFLYFVFVHCLLFMPQIGMKEKLAVVLFKTAHSALDFSMNAGQVFGPEFKVTSTSLFHFLR
jgi:hypothetical protein